MVENRVQLNFFCRRYLGCFFCLIAFLWCSFELFGDLDNAQKSSKWICVVGTMKMIEIEESTKDSMYWPKVSYVYDVAGQTYSGNQISFPNPVLKKLEVSNAFKEKYAPNKKVDVFYDKVAPEKSCLEPGVRQAFSSKFSCAFVFLAIALILPIVPLPGRYGPTLLDVIKARKEQAGQMMQEPNHS